MSKGFLVSIALIALTTSVALAGQAVTQVILNSPLPVTPKVFIACMAAALHLVDENERSFTWALLKEWRRDPRREAEAAIAANDHLLLGMAGFGLFFPGAPRRDDQPPPGYHYREILGAGCSPIGEVQNLYSDLSYRNAKIFNGLVLMHFGIPPEPRERLKPLP